MQKLGAVDASEHISKLRQASNRDLEQRMKRRPRFSEGFWRGLVCNAQVGDYLQKDLRR